MKKETLSLSRMQQGETGRIIEISGGQQMMNRLEVMGIKEGAKVRKVSGQLFNGPVTVLINNTHTAIGFGMARKIIVELD